MWRLFLILLAISLTHTMRADAATTEEDHARRKTLETIFESEAGQQFDCFRRSPNGSVLFLPSERFDTGGDSKLGKLSGQFAGHIAKLAQSALEASDATLAYELLNEAVFFGDTTLADKVVGVRPKSPVAKLATTIHPRLGWKRRDYYRVHTDHYQIVTKDKSAGIEIATRLETLYSVWGQLFFDCWSDASRLASAMERHKTLLPKTTRLHRVVLFANRADYIEYLRANQPRIDITLGFYDVNSRTSYFFAGPDSSPATQLHEVTHQLFQEVQSISPQLKMERNFWAIEGIALYMESLQRRGSVAVVGGFHANRLQFARYRRLQEDFYVPLRELVAMGRDRLQTDERIRRIYSQSAGLAHFLMDGQAAKHRSGFIDYLNAIYKGRDRIDTLATATSSSLDALDSEYRRFLDVTDADLSSSMIPENSLRSLCLGNTHVTDEGLNTLASQEKLDWLNLTRTDVGDEGLRFIEKTAALRQVSVDGTRITDQTLRLLARNKGIEELDVSNTAITDEGLKYLTQMKALQVLWLSNTAISDDSMRAIGQLESLRHLAIDGTQVTEDARSALRKNLPNLTVE